MGRNIRTLFSAGSRAGRRRPRLRALWLASMLGSASAGADELRNWFDDPFFQVTSAIAGCPQPAGPYTDERGRREQAHHRAEKGTTCWLARECERPMAYAYDAEIAESVRQAFARARRFDRSSLWVTVQGRIVYIEGCVPAATWGTRLERMVGHLPHVQQAVAIVRSSRAGEAPYRLRQPPP